MKIEELCQYLNELGILDIKHTSVFLSLYSNFMLNNKQIKTPQYSEDNTLKMILFAYLKNIVLNDKELYQICSNIINLYNKNKLIRLYQGICFLKKVLFYQIKNKFNHFLFLLFKKKYPKRKYYPYNPNYAIKIIPKSNDNKYQRTFNNEVRRGNNILNDTEDYSLSYISIKNNNKNNFTNIHLNTGGSLENVYSQPDIGSKVYTISHMNFNNSAKLNRNDSQNKKKFIDITEKMKIKKKRNIRK